MVTRACAYRVTEATPRDIPAIAGLLDQLNRVEGYTQTTDEAMLEAALFGTTREVKLAALVAQADAHVVGVLLYYPGYDTLSASVGYHLADMVVDAVWRSQGIGRALMRTLAQRVLAEGKAWISLTALKHNAAARVFYQTLGMSEVAVDFFAMGKSGMSQIVRM